MSSSPRTQLVCRRELVDKIYDRLNGAMTKSEISAIVDLAVTEISDEVVADRGSVSFPNLGTFSIYLVPGHRGYNANSKQVEQLPEKKRVRFHPHVAFSKLLSERRKKFAL